MFKNYLGRFEVLCNSVPESIKEIMGVLVVVFLALMVIQKFLKILPMKKMMRIWSVAVARVGKSLALPKPYPKVERTCFVLYMIVSYALSIPAFFLVLAMMHSYYSVGWESLLINGFWLFTIVVFSLLTWFLVAQGEQTRFMLTRNTEKQ